MGTPSPEAGGAGAGPRADSAVVGLLEGMATTRAIRRYTDEPVTDSALQQLLFAATRAPSGSNRQPFRFVVLRDSPAAVAAKSLVAEVAQQQWSDKRDRDGYRSGSGRRPDSPKARMAHAMDEFVAALARAPVMILPCLVRYREPTPSEGSSIYPACQNLLLAARALGLGGVMTHWHHPVADRLASLLAIPDDAVIAATITIGHPVGAHGPVRRRPLSELVFEDRWDQSPAWAVDPPGTRFTSAGPPRPR